MLRTEEIEEDVDLRPRRPVGPEESRYEERGVIGAGDKDNRWRGVGTLGRLREVPDICRTGVFDTLAIGRTGGVMLGTRGVSLGALLGGCRFSAVASLPFETGDFPRFAFSLNHNLMEARGFNNLRCGFLAAVRLETPFVGAMRAELVETSCNVLPRDRLLSLGGGIGLLWFELAERACASSFSIGGGGTGEPGESRVKSSGRRGSSGKTS